MSTIEALPQEILVKILSFLSFKDLCRFRQVTHRMWFLSQDKNFWTKIKMSFAVLPGHLIKDMIRFDVKYLSIPCCTIKSINTGFLKDHEPNLINLNVACCDGNIELLADIVAASKSLKSLNLSMSSNTHEP